MFVHATNSETPDRVWVTTNKMVGTRYMALDRNSTIVDVCICGAIGDGVTDDTAALQAAIAAVPAGGTLYAPRGRTFLTADRVQSTNSWVSIDFSGSTLRSFVPSRRPAIQIGPNAILLSGLNFALDPTTNKITVPAGTFAPGDMVGLYNGTESPADYHRGQFAFVTAVSGTTVTLDRFPSAALLVTNAYRYVNPPQNCTVRNINVDLANAVEDGIGISVAGRGHVVENCRVNGDGTPADKNYLGISLTGQSITARNNYVIGILDAGNADDRSGYGIFMEGDSITLENNEIHDCKHTISTSSRVFRSTRLRMLNNVCRQRGDWENLTDSNGALIFHGNLDVHANVDNVLIQGNYCDSWGRWNASIRNGNFDVVNNYFVIHEQAGLPFAQQQIGFNEAITTRGVIQGNHFVTPDASLILYFGHRLMNYLGSHSNLLVTGNTFEGGLLAFQDMSGTNSNPFCGVSILGNQFSRSDRKTPLLLFGTMTNFLVSHNLLSYGTNGNGIAVSSDGADTNSTPARQIYITGNYFSKDQDGTGYDVSVIAGPTNLVALGENRWSASWASYLGPVHGIDSALPVGMYNSRDTYPRIIGTHDGKLKFGSGTTYPYSSLSLLYPGALVSDAIIAAKVSTPTAPAFGTYSGTFSNIYDFVVRGDGVMAYRYIDTTDTNNIVTNTPIVLGPQRYKDMTGSVWRVSASLGLTMRPDPPIVPETDTATLWLANAAASVRDLRIVWPDGLGGKDIGKLWHEFNDGIGSGLDSDLLDGQHGDYYLARSNHVGTQSVSTITGLGPLATGDAPTNGVPHGRQDGAWVEIPATNHVHSDYYPRSGGTNNPITGPVVLGYSTPALVLRDTSGTNVVTFTYGGPWGELVFGRADPSSLTSIGVTYAVFSDTQAIFSTDLSAPTVTGNTVSSLGYLNAGDDLRLSAADADSPGVVMLNNSGTLGVRQWFDGAHWNLYTASATPPYAEIEKLVRVETNGIVTVQKPIRTRTGTLGYLTPVAGHAPGAAAATVSTRNSKPIVAYDPTTEEHYRWTWVIPNGFNTPALDGADNLNFLLHWTSSATSGSVRWVVKLQRLTGVDIDSDSFGSGSVVTTAVSGTAGTVVVSTTGNVGLDSAVAGDAVEIDVYRDTGDAGDTVDSNDAELLAIEIRNW